ncbi:MAG: hypothetical protein HZB23_08510 [Deltaproteobacteria bacterium]|nr:hypothetical protein [Deltaproteobacteria bacterium]
MESTELGKYTRSFGTALAMTSLFSAILVVVKESSPPVLDWMKQVTVHHWVTHGLLNMIVFLAAGFGLGFVGNGRGIGITPKNLVSAIVGSIVAGSLIIAGFFLIAG